MSAPARGRWPVVGGRWGSRLRGLVGRGFTLLEVIVAMAILSLSMMAIFDLNSGAVGMHAYTKRLTVATLLARSKMTDIEQELFEKGLPNDDDEDGGDFSDEGWPGFKWRSKVLAPKTQGIAPEQIAMSLFGLGGGGEDDEGGGGNMLSALAGGGGGGGDLGALAAMFGGNLPTGGAGAGAGGLAAMGPMAGLMSTQMTQMVDQITKTVREVHVTVSWKDGNQVETLDLVTHVVSLGPGSDRNGGGAAAGAGGFNTGALGAPPPGGNPLQTLQPPTNFRPPFMPPIRQPFGTK